MDIFKSYENTSIYLLATSLLFIIPVIMTIYNKQWLLSSACIFIFIGSTLHHSTRTHFSWYIDKFACYYLAGVSILYAIQYHMLYILIPLITYILFIYYYGYYTKCLCFHEDTRVNEYWHSTIHIFSALLLTYASYFISSK